MNKLMVFILAWGCFVMALWDWSEHYYFTAGAMVFCFIVNTMTLNKPDREG